MPSLRSSFVPVSFATCLAASAALAACSGASRPPPDVAQAMDQVPPDGDAGASSGDASVTPAQAGDAEGPSPAIVMPTTAPTKLGAELAALGLDAKKLPPLGKLEPDKMRKVMKLMSTSLGVSCTHCHDGDDFHKQTPRKRVAERMWNEWVRGYAHAEGSAPVFCDSCHQGKAKFLDKSDPKALSGWMKTNFVEKLKRVDGKDNGCASCHGDPFDGDFLEKWAKK